MFSVGIGPHSLYCKCAGPADTLIWKYDSFNWRVGINNITAADVDNNYGLFIDNLTAGTFDTVGGIMLTHELNNFTMQEAVKWCPQLKSSFSVRCTA
jgi:hypothetical protein